MNQDSPKRQRLKLLNSYIIIILLIVSSLPLHAQAGIAAGNTVNVNYTKVSAANLLNELAKQSNYTISFNTPAFEQLQLNNISYKKVPLTVVLKELEKKTKLSFMVSGNHISAVIIENKKINRKPGRISGRIVDDKGEPLPGASIKLIELNKVITSSVDGTYSFNVEPGTYTIEVSYISFQTKRIADIITTEGALTKLDIVLKVSSSSLNEVVIKSSFKKESIAGLYAQQKNAASMTDGISAEQISKTPDNNVGAVLKRVSGVNTIDNKYVVVRGMTERYNQAMIDGIVLPSTDMNRRNFSFDVVPAELVSSVVVNKTATPDVSSEFSGGQVTVNTLTIPEKNFTSISVGAGLNSRTVGKDLLSVGGRGKYDYFAFDDGQRKQPGNIKYWVFPAKGIGADNPVDYEPTALEQSKRFNPDGFKLYNNAARPSQNYRMVLGRLYDISDKLKIGFVGGLTYRNTQEINDYKTIRGYGHQDVIETDSAGRGKISKFNTTWGATLNGGLHGEKFKINTRNLYTRMLSNDSYDVYKRQNDALEAKERSIFADPVFTDVLQNKLEGEHRLLSTGLLLNWSASRTQVDQDHKDLRNFTYRYTTNINGQDIYQTPDLATSNELGTGFNFDYRVWTQVKQTDYNWALNLSQQFNFLKDKSTVKVGYAGWYKQRQQSTVLVNLYTAYTGETDVYAPYEIILSPEQQGYGNNKAYYFANAENSGDQYKGTSKNHAAYLMLDQRFFQKLRLVYGVRAENFNSKNKQLAEIESRKRRLQQNPDATFQDNPPVETGEKNWRFLPSANLTYSLTSQMNFRAAYSVTMIRPDLRETATMAFVDPLLRGEISGGNLSSTRIDNYDLRYEWYPASGEIISVSAFYKKFDKPVELMKAPDLNKYYFTNQKSAVNQGIEMEVRKSLGFIADQQWLRNLSLFGNATLMKSKVIVEGEREVSIPDGEKKKEKFDLQIKRPLFGQSPYIVNGGISYASKYFGLNAVFNRSGYRTYIVEFAPNNVEYENGRNIVDLQLSTRLFKQKVEIRLNISNLLDNSAIYYINATGYDISEDRMEAVAAPGKSDKYSKSEGDIITHKIKYGRTANLSFTYNF